MIDFGVITKNQYTLGAVDYKVVKGFMGVSTLKQDTKEIDSLIDKAIVQTEGKIGNTVVSKRIAIDDDINGLSFGSFHIDSENFCNWMKGCKEIICISGTAGFELERIIEKNKRLEGSLALAISALGSERVENLLDRYCDELEKIGKTEGFEITPRFSPGYGNVGLHNQVNFMNELDLQRQLGISLNDSYFMTPTKTVTAFIGIRWK